MYFNIFCHGPYRAASNIIIYYNIQKHLTTDYDLTIDENWQLSTYATVVFADLVQRLIFSTKVV